MMNPLDLLQLERNPDHPVVLTGDRALTRGDLLRRAGAVAGQLRDADVDRRSVVVSLDSGPGFVAALAGTWMAGGFLSCWIPWCGPSWSGRWR